MSQTETTAEKRNPRHKLNFIKWKLETMNQLCNESDRMSLNDTTATAMNQLCNESDRMSLNDTTAKGARRIKPPRRMPTDLPPSLTPAGYDEHTHRGQESNDDIHRGQESNDDIQSAHQECNEDIGYEEECTDNDRNTMRTPNRPKLPVEVGPKSKTTLFVSNLSYKLRNNGLSEVMGQFGNIVDCHIVKFYDHWEQRLKSKGFGFVSFETEEGAKKAHETVQDFMIGDRAAFSKFSTSTGPKGKYSSHKKTPKRYAEPEAASLETSGTEVYVSGFDENATKDDIQNMFEGEILKIQIQKKNRRRRDSQKYSYAHVQFMNEEDAKRAIEGNSDGGGSNLKVEMSKRAHNRLFKEEKPTKQEKPENKRRRLYVTNFPDEYGVNELRELFEDVGVVEVIQVKTSRATTDRFAYITFKDKADAAQVLEEQWGDIVIEWAKSNRRRRRSRNRDTREEYKGEEEDIPEVQLEVVGTSEETGAPADKVSTEEALETSAGAVPDEDRTQTN